ncbi:hypothetical protein F2Z06_19995 [Phocaeicola dorei]|uniref:Uncharacterized protein n=1 Tax=Phocaeicola dorei TaxID=357276 RepID=A0A6L3J0A0_9BACT|nr:hypothetical protein F2Z06_19995 [Phocaeicola dorei]KAA5298256.1 hypothetical protein F2Z19_19850 [Phocaeicola dorei]KAA5305802.1 hypothetical protein F2Z01_20310 [Phocaeicola dorei]KAA5306074.1 hypothetical protein F2Z00_20220 [Phocaeicola dorei]KAA5315068.1 hypothetical protein F2Z05_20220 [Phocaeicola dorei]
MPTYVICEPLVNPALLVKRIKKEIPNLYNSLALDFPNPYASQCRSTPTHYILVHSAIEYFIKK